ALKFLEILIPRNISKLALNKVAYCYFLNELAAFKDDLTVARIDNESYLLTWNASNKNKNWYWLQEIKEILSYQNPLDINISDFSNNTAMFAFQGPDAPKLTEKFFGIYPGPWKCSWTSFKGIKILIMGTGYTGEAGCEIVIYNTTIDNPTNALSIWESILEFGEKEKRKITPCGLGARDTLRLEAGMPLYGNDIDETTPITHTGLNTPSLVDSDKLFFIGKTRMSQLKMEPTRFKRVGLVTLARGRSPRIGMKILSDDNKEVGYITSGTFSPLLKIGIGMGYVSTNIPEGTEIKIKTENFEIPARISSFPLYDISRYGSKRIS
ncbi:MAG: aminomethyltransferase family protein, partial [Candidatus Thorarchaeota archaeon]